MISSIYPLRLVPGELTQALVTLDPLDAVEPWRQRHRLGVVAVRRVDGRIERPPLDRSSQGAKRTSGEGA